MRSFTERDGPISALVFLRCGRGAIVSAVSGWVMSITTALTTAFGTLRPLRPPDLGWAERQRVRAKRGGNCTTNGPAVVLTRGGSTRRSSKKPKHCLSGSRHQPPGLPWPGRATHELLMVLESLRTARRELRDGQALPVRANLTIGAGYRTAVLKASPGKLVCSIAKQRPERYDVYLAAHAANGACRGP